MLPELCVHVAVIDHPITIEPVMYGMRNGMGSTSLPNHTPRLMTFCFGELKSYPNPGSQTIVAMEQSAENANNFGPGNPSSTIDNNVEWEGGNQVFFNVAANLLPPNFKKASFLTPEMVRYHKNEHEHPGN
jgi:hypothetical protein